MYNDKNDLLRQMGHVFTQYVAKHADPNKTLAEVFEEFKNELTLDAIREAHEEINRNMMGAQQAQANLGGLGSLP